MSLKTYAIITDVHGNSSSLKEAIKIINKRDDVDQIICLGDYFALGPDPMGCYQLLKSLSNCIFLRGNHERYLIENLWTHERPNLEGMSPDDPICKEIVQNEKWTAEMIGEKGRDFCNKTRIAERQIIEDTLVEFTHAWYQRDEIPPTMDEAIAWKNHISKANNKIKRFIFVHGHTHLPRKEEKENLKILCQGATGLPFDEDPRGSIAFLKIGRKFNWEIVRYEYDRKKSIDMLEDIKPPFYKNLQNTIRYATIRNDI